MNKDIIKTEMYVNKNKINVIRINNKEYISLTDLARYANLEEPKIPVQTWMRNKDVISYLGLWENLITKISKVVISIPLKMKLESIVFTCLLKNG